MAKEAKVNKIEVQKGPIVADQPNYRYMTQRQLVEQDMEWIRGREEGKRMTFHEPKK